MSRANGSAKNLEGDLDLYAILNLNKGASLTEINERHRALSLLFHPDRRPSDDVETKEAATEEFLKIQKAYQILSDPFLREVYDVLGERGLSVNWPHDLPLKSKEEIQQELKRIQSESSLDQSFDPKSPLKTKIVATADATPLFKPPGTIVQGRVLDTPFDRLKSLWLVSEELTYSISKRINNNTTASVAAQTHVRGGRLGFTHYLGTIRHQFSPRFTGEAILVIGKPLLTKFNGTYQDEYNTVNMNIALSPVDRQLVPIADISFTRRLFRLKPQSAGITLHLGEMPALSLTYLSPASVTQEIIDANRHGLSSTSGLRYAFFEKSFGLVFTDVVPKLVGEISVTFLELATRLKFGMEFGLAGLGFTLGAHWNKDEREANILATMHSQGIVLQVDFTYWRQKFALPIILSTDFNPYIAFCTAVVPSTAAAVGYHFIIRPRRRAQRIAQIRAARQTLEEDSDSRKKRTAVVELLQDAARRYTNLETAKGGLVVQEAAYAVADAEDGADGLTMNVTIPLQALVRNSQLYIPGGRTKSSLQGFSDPAPFTAKSLRIRYLFHGRSHYADIPDYLPVVLPLSEHYVGEC